MKKQTALDALSETQRREAIELLRQWKQKTWLTASVALGMTVLAALLLSAVWDIGMPEAAAICALFVTLAMTVALNIQKQHFVQSLAEIPELNERQRIPTGKPGKSPSFSRICELVLVTLLCPPLGIPLLLFTKDSKREQEHAQLTNTPKTALTHMADVHAERLGCGGLLIFGAACCWIVLSGMLGFVAKGKLASLNNSAKNIYISANAVLAEMQEAEEPLPQHNTVCIVNANGEFTVNSLEWRIEQYFTDIRRTGVWYALEFDYKGSVSAAWISYQPLTEQDLVPPDQDVQLKLLSSLFQSHAQEAIGYYTEQE